MTLGDKVERHVSRVSKNTARQFYFVTLSKHENGAQVSEARLVKCYTSLLAAKRAATLHSGFYDCAEIRAYENRNGNIVGGCHDTGTVVASGTLHRNADTVWTAFPS